MIHHSHRWPNRSVEYGYMSNGYGHASCGEVAYSLFIVAMTELCCSLLFLPIFLPNMCWHMRWMDKGWLELGGCSFHGSLCCRKIERALHPGNLQGILASGLFLVFYSIARTRWFQQAWSNCKLKYQGTVNLSLWPLPGQKIGPCLWKWLLVRIVRHPTLLHRTTPLNQKVSTSSVRRSII